MSAFHEGLAEILEVETTDLSPTMTLAEHGWDSLAIISCVALIDECFGTVGSGSTLVKCRTMADLDDLVAQTVGA